MPHQPLENLPAPAQYMRFVLAECGINQKVLAERMGVTTKHLSRVLNGRDRVTPFVAVKFATATRTSPYMLLYMQANYDIRMLEGNDTSPDRG